MSGSAVSDSSDSSCGVCYGVLYITRTMLAQQRGPKCFGYLAPPETNPVRRDADDELPEHLDTLVVIGKASVISPMQIGSVSGIRFVVISNREDDVAQDVINVDWKEAIQRQLTRQKEAAAMLGERMVWQLSSSGMDSLKQQLAAFTPAAKDFAQTYVRKMKSFFNGEPPKTRE